VPARATGRTAAVALALALGLAGCGTGLKAQTYEERATADSTNQAVGALALRGVRVLAPPNGTSYAAGSDATVALTVVNQGSQPDHLTTVTSDAADSVDVVDATGKTTTLTVAPQASVSSVALVLKGLNREVRPGTYVSLTMTFAESGSRQMLVPVQLTDSQAPNTNVKVPDTDSEGNPLPEGPSGADQPDPTTDPIGDNNAGTGGASPPPAG
jgi:copper(I)-binding protein